MSEYVLVDQAARDRFTGEVDGDFSVIAPAGVGKTRAIVERILGILEGAGAEVEVRAGELVVVTYTQKAAEEMRERARLEIIRRGHGDGMLRALSRAFFGTIHSFCLKLIREEGVALGLGPGLGLCEDVERVWRRFMRERDDFTVGLDAGVVERVKQWVGLERVLDLGKVLGPGVFRGLEVPYPAVGVEWDLVLEYPAEGRNAAKIKEGKAVLRRWIEAYEGGAEGIGLPEFGYGGSEFKAVWAEMVKPLWKAANAAGRYVGAKVAEDFLAYRLREGVITYDDMVYLAGELVGDAGVRAEIKRQGYRVILDEAQDTDRVQFEILLGCAGEGPGHFSMVGDPQQSIYSERADVGEYLGLHERMVGRGALEALEFVVTMRCDRGVVAGANGVFPKVLNGQGAQVEYVALEARPWAGEGKVSRLSVDEDSGAALAEFLREAGLGGLGVERWSEVAVLAPRKAWLMEVKEALEGVGLKAQVHSRGDIQGDQPVYAWLAALIRVAAEPYDGYELYGFLREVYGYSDHALAVYQREYGLSSGGGHAGRGEVGETLEALHALREGVRGGALLGACEQWVRGVGLVERMEACGLGGVGEYLADFYQLATQVEAEGGGMRELCEVLEAGFDKAAPGETPEGDAVQLYTCHKAKGLEWRVVVLMDMFRKVAYPSASYPRVYGEGEVVVSAHPGKEILDGKKGAQQRGELERLLYVAATRAKEHLIYVDDSGLRQKYEGSMAEALGVEAGGKNRGVWEGLPEVEILAEAPYPTEVEVEAVGGRVVPSGVSADNFPRRKTPSSLVEHGEGGRVLGGESGGAAYGDFWHGLMEGLPWGEGEDPVKETALRGVSGEVFEERARRELGYLFESQLFGKMVAEGARVYTEVPFVHSSVDGALYEGVMDALLVEEDGRRVVVDWKTDSVEGMEGLHKYGLQVGVYVEALQCSGGGEVVGVLYSTQLGQSIEVDFEREMA